MFRPATALRSSQQLLSPNTGDRRYHKHLASRFTLSLQSSAKEWRSRADRHLPEQTSYPVPAGADFPLSLPFLVRPLQGNFLLLRDFCHFRGQDSGRILPKRSSITTVAAKGVRDWRIRHHWTRTTVVGLFSKKLGCWFVIANLRYHSFSTQQFRSPL